MIIYRNADARDLLQVAKVHKEQFSTHFLGKFSLTLIRSFYEYLHAANQIFVVAVEGETVVGFVLGGNLTELEKQQSAFVSRWKVRSLIESILRPNVWGDILEKVKRQIKRKSAKRKDNAPGTSKKEEWCLLSIAVKGDCKRKGIGVGLVRAFDERMSQFCHSYDLCVNRDNTSAVSFYKAIGFKIDYERPTFFGMSKECNPKE